MEIIPFKADGHNITCELLQFTRDLLAYGFTNKEVSELTGLGKNTVKEIDLQRLKGKYTVDGKTIVVRRTLALQQVHEVYILTAGTFDLPCCVNSTSAAVKNDFE